MFTGEYVRREKGRRWTGTERISKYPMIVPAIDDVEGSVTVQTIGD